MKEVPTQRKLLDEIILKALQLEIESKQIFVFPTELNQTLKELKNVFCDLEKNGLGDLQQLRDDIKNWCDFTGRIDSMVEYLESKDDVMKQTTNQSLSPLEIEEKKCFLEVKLFFMTFYCFRK